MRSNNNNNVFQIAAVCADWPENSHFLFDFLISTTGFEFTRQLNYINFAAHTYLLLNPGTSAKSLEAKLPIIIKKYVAGDIEKRLPKISSSLLKKATAIIIFFSHCKKFILFRIWKASWVRTEA